MGVFANDSSGRLQQAAVIEMPTCPVELVPADFDGMAGLEMLTSSFDGSVMLMALPEGPAQMK